MFESVELIAKSLFKKASLIRTIPATVITIVTTAINIGAPYLLITVLPKIKEDPQPEDDNLNTEQVVYLLMGAYSCTWLLGKTLPLVREMLLGPLSADLSSSLTKKVIKQYYTLPMAHRVDHSTGSEVRHFSNIYEHVGDCFINTFYGELFPAGFEMLSIGGVVTYFYPSVGACLAGIVIIYSGTAIVGARFISEAQINKNDNAFKSFESVLSRLEKYETAHYYDNIAYELSELSDGLLPFNNAINKANLTRSGLGLILGTVMGVGYGGTMMLSIHYASTLKLYKADDLVWVILYLTQFVTDLDLFSKSLNKLREAHISYQDIVQYLEQAHDFKDDHLKLNLNADITHTNISFDNVTLRYQNGEKDSLSNVSFQIDSGETVALVGKSGSGKSSILNLLCRFYNPSVGTVSINNQLLSYVNQVSIRKTLAIIPQNAYLINDTIFNNVKYGDLNASDMEVYEAIKRSQLMHIHKQYQMQTIGENGKKLSGGQKQRVAIARAILRLIRGATILIADEPTSALDEKTARQVITEIFNLAKSNKPQCITTIFVTHNLKEVVNEDFVDKLIVIDNGQIKAQGKVSELLNQTGFFSASLKQSLAIAKEDHDLRKNDESFVVEDSDSGIENELFTIGTDLSINSDRMPQYGSIAINLDI